ncbi:hypothetical protein [Microbacterium sp. zg-YB36]|uniref:hypothetical protein n=1 Tax=Microbacterium sp. zg-YB36 TaxID=2969407 RepID=UPI00214CE125|nr:hypothetical protein [Microbacterium sp. zg-YB36]MDL5351206.1 hypothetical protein [Microbacterium sp. zg-YB36]
MILDGAVFDAAMDEIAQRSRKSLYQRDYLAWASDVLGRRYYEKMAGIMVECATPSNGRIRNAIKSANGCGKSFAVSDLGVWWITAFPPEESLALFSANGREQIKTVIFKYLKDAYGYMATQAKQTGGARPIGWISEQLEWNYQKPDGSGKEAIAIGKRPADADIVSAFQGTRKYRTLVGLDEMGGLPEDLLTAAEAVMTGQDSRILGIGNPDNRATPFYNLFTTDAGADWNLHTISAYELPTMTGEIVYPDDPQKQAGMLKGLTSKSWIAHKERAWKVGGDLVPDDEFPDDEQYVRRVGGTPNGRFLAKVLGEFPGDADNTFFAEEHITLARETVIEYEPTTPVVLGVDIATTGSDESVIYVNRGGNLRLFADTITYQDGLEMRETTGVWSKEDTLTNARRIHAIAKHLGASEVRIDGNAVGSGVATDLMRSAEFSDREYDVIRVVGSKSSSDIARWRIWRDEIHDHFADQMRDGLLDLDPADNQLRDELMLITYKLLSGAIKIDKKSDMKTMMGGSPDRADAAMYAALRVRVDPDAGVDQAVPARDVAREITAERRRRRPLPV